MINFTFIKKYVPRWAVLLFDLIVSLSSLVIAYFLRFNFDIPDEFLATFIYVIPIVGVVRGLSFLLSKTYAGVVRYTSTRDAFRISVTVLFGSMFLMMMNLVDFAITRSFVIPFSVILIDLALAVSFLIVIRVGVKALYFESINGHKFFENVLIYGGDEYGLATKRTLERDPKTKFKIIAYIDNLSKGKKIDAIDVFAVYDLERIIDEFNISYLIMAKKERFHSVENEIIETCLKYNVNVLRIPQISDWINGELSIKQIRQIKIEDLLERLPISLDEKKISENIFNKKVLVTGAAGSIGSEIVRQLTKYSPKLIILFDQAESPLYDLELEISEKLRCKNIETVIGDVSDKTRMKKLFEVLQPDIIYHAAAYKHVPMMENNPYEAVKTNVNGTMILADLAEEFGVEKFVMVSTDKAVNPTNVMGASKRIAEIYTQSFNSISKTKFITTRFGNVLGSNGSVIPRFRKQIQQGGPVTVTHPEITRYFMTIPEACQLVLEAGAFGVGGEIFIFDMGKSVKIVDLAKKMIQLSGLTLGIDIQIKFTGLRPGEKLYEELLNEKENTLPTHHPQIMIAKVTKYEFEEVKTKIRDLLVMNFDHDNIKTVTKMKEIVPEFISQNSQFEQLNKKQHAENQ